MFSLFLSSVPSVGELTNTDKQEQQIKLIAHGDREALAQLYSETKDAVYGFTLSFLKNPYDCEDILQDTYIKIYNASASYKPCGKPMAWIFTIARNLCLMKLRSEKKNVDCEDTDLDRYYSENDRVTSEDKIVLNAVLKNLSDTEAQIVMMHAVSGFKNREIAEILKLPVSTVLSKYNRALKKLKKQLEEGENND